jgi:hypothetical protein
MSHPAVLHKKQRLNFLSQTQLFLFINAVSQSYMFQPEKAISRHTYKIYKRKVLGIRPPLFLHKNLQLFAKFCNFLFLCKGRGGGLILNAFLLQILYI